MNSNELSLNAQELRGAFDSAYARAPRGNLEQLDDLLAIRLGDDPYAIRLAHLAGLFADKAVTAMPSTDSGFLGIAGFRGALVPVYDLRVLLGYAGREPPRWLAIASANRVALAFDDLDGYLRIPKGGFAGQEHDDLARPHVRELVRTSASALPRALIDLDSVVASIEQRTSQPLPQLETGN